MVASARIWENYIHGFFEIPHDGPPTFMLNITAYVDESQHEATGQHVVVGGFCGSEEQWKSFGPCWSDTLKPRKSLHMKSLRWKGAHAEKRVRGLLERLGPIPKNHGLCPVYGAVRVSDYYDIIEGYPELEQKMCGYVLCLSVVLSVLSRDLPPEAIVTVVCEQQNQYQPLALGLFDSFSHIAASSPKNAYFKALTFIPKDRTVLTQPADYLSFAMTKYLDERGSRKDKWCRPIFAGKNPERIAGRTHTREKARHLVAEVLQARKENRSIRIRFV